FISCGGRAPPGTFRWGVADARRRASQDRASASPTGASERIAAAHPPGPKFTADADRGARVHANRARHQTSGAVAPRLRGHQPEIAMYSTDRRAAHRATSCRASLARKCERLARLLRIAGLWCSSDGPHPWPQAKGQAGAGRQVPGGRKWILVAEDDRAVRT